MSEETVETDVEVDVERLDSEAINEHLRSSTSVLQQILQSDQECDENRPAKTGGDHTCSYCGKLYKTASTLNMHVLLKHPQNKVEVRCAICDKTYASYLSLQKHFRYMHRYPNRCQACYRTFETPKLLAQHGALCVRSERPCPLCGKMYDSLLSLRNHIKYKHPEKKTNWCDICRRAFNSTRGLANHCAAIHPNGMVCSRCDKEFNSVAALHSHFLYKHSETGERCNMCRKVFASRRSLSRHLEKNHNIVVCEDGGRYTCGVCNAGFQNSAVLIEHVMQLHTGTKSSSSV